MFRRFIILIVCFIALSFGCRTDADCGCGGECDTSHPDDNLWDCTTLGDTCTGFEPYCSPYEHRCVQCNQHSECSGNTPQCIQNECKECSTDRDCASNSDCNAECLDYSCQFNNRLNCLGTGQRCLIGSAICVDCISDFDCTNDTPFCDRFNRICRGCESDTECKSDNNCGAFCNSTSGLCETPDTSEKRTIVDCTLTPETGLCNPDTSECVGCVTDSDCLGNVFLRKCNTERGQCHQCNLHSECRDRGNCNAHCVEIFGGTDPNYPVFVCRDKYQINKNVCSQNQQCNVTSGECFTVPSSSNGILITSWGTTIIVLVLIMALH